ncbi:MAG: class I SAM-dependent methyltransferase [Magnetococcales bacterium]|nr:class I SAM-dependent methyltransferase [Magnetococcales bacterium]
MNTLKIPDPILVTLRIPDMNDVVEWHGESLCNARTGEAIPMVNGVPDLWPSGATGPENQGEMALVRDYSATPEFGDLVTFGHGNPRFRGLLDAIGHNRLILELGCGSGQLTNYLQLNNNFVLGIDSSLDALNLAGRFRLRTGLTRSAFARMHPRHLAIRDQSFDVILLRANHPDPQQTRLTLAQGVQKLKTGGCLIVEGFNPYARPGRRFTLDEVLAWFAAHRLDYLNCFPPVLDTPGESARTLFSATHPGNRFQRVITQLAWLTTLNRTSGVFLVAGRKLSA